VGTFSGLRATAGLVALSLVTAPAIAGKNSQPFRTEVPGGIDSTKLAKLWQVTKAKCLEMGYSIENEDRDLKTLLCSLPSPMGSYTILVVFDQQGFSVTSKGTATRVPLMGSLMNSAKKRRKEMIAALRQAALGQ
jgi:hypothetical protein